LVVITAETAASSSRFSSVNGTAEKSPAVVDGLPAAPITAAQRFARVVMTIRDNPLMLEQVMPPRKGA
jgi:hypothetical protein